MKLKEKEITLSNGQACILRSLVPQDAEALLGQLRQVSGETRFMLREPEEITMTLRQEREILKSAQKQSDSVMLGAFHGNTLIANCGFSPVSGYERIRHRASMGICVIASWWNLGIGTAMIRELIRLAGQAGYQQLELSVTGDNERARTLYKKEGFIECGCIPNAFHYRDGSYADEVHMFYNISAG